jgi:glucokinase
MNTLAIDIGGTKLAVALFTGPDTLPPKMIRREVRPTDRTGGPHWMLDQIADVVRRWSANDDIANSNSFGFCGVGFGGPVDFARQQVTLSTHVEGWRDFPLVTRLRETLRVPVVIDNDANVGALGEAIYGAGRERGQKDQFRPLFYMTLSTGIGGGIVLEGNRVLRGPDSYAGEIGHLTIRPDGPECLCGARGCLERLCCGLWLERDYGKPPAELLAEPAFVERYVEDLALGLKAAIMLLNPARIVIGGGIAKAGDRLFVPLRAALKRHITDWSRARVDVVPAKLGDDSVLWGALALAAASSTVKIKFS